MLRQKIKVRPLSPEEAVLDKGLAGLGDAYINFAYSVAVSVRDGRPSGVKVDNRVLAEALRRAGLRGLLPSRIDRHDMGNAAEAIIVYSWLKGAVSFEECVDILSSSDDPVEAFTLLLRMVARRLGVEVGG